MGYYTDFSITYDTEDEAIEKALLDKLSNYITEEDIFYSIQFNAKWYSFEQDMKEISSLFPDILFTVEGNGDEQDDIWIAYFKYGKMQMEQAKITFGEFDENKLS